MMTTTEEEENKHYEDWDTIIISLRKEANTASSVSIKVSRQDLEMFETNTKTGRSEMIEMMIQTLEEQLVTSSYVINKVDNSEK